MQINDRQDFEDRLSSVTTPLVESLSGLLAECNIRPRGVDIERSLEIDRSLAWHVASVVASRNPAAVAEHMPSHQGIEIVLRAAGRRATPPMAAMDAVKLAVDRFAEFQAAVAGDRATLLGMLAAPGAADASTRKAMALAAKQAFRANSQIFGLHARVQFQIDCVWPDVASGLLSLATLRGWVGLTRLRSDAVIRLGAFRCHPGSEAAPQPAGQPMPLDPQTAAIVQAPVVKLFCSDHLQPFRVEPDNRGAQAVFVAQGELGLSGAFDLTLGEWMGPGPSAYGDGPGERAEVFVRHYVPSALLVHDWLIHRDLLGGPWAGRAIEHEIYSELSLGGLFPLGRANKPRLAGRLALPRLGPAEHVMCRTETPRHREMIDWLCRSRGLSSAAFDLYRAEVAHPVVPATSVMGLEMPVRKA